MHWAGRPRSHEERRAAGLGVLSALDGDGDRAALRDALAELAPDFAELTVEVAYGDFWSRPGLDPARRELATVAALCALGRERQLAAHLGSALHAGVTRDQLIEVLMHMAIYAGWPAAVTGLLVARDAFSVGAGDAPSDAFPGQGTTDRSPKDAASQPPGRTASGYDIGAGRAAFGFDAASARTVSGYDVGAGRAAFGFDVAAARTASGSDVGAGRAAFGFDVAPARTALGFDVGAARVTVVSDGEAELPAAMFAGGVDPAELARILRRHRLPEESVRLALNGLVLEHAGRLIVVDPGSGPADGPHTHGLVAPTQGHFLHNLAGAGFAAADVTLVVLTHAHHDHATAVLAPDGGLSFPNAKVAISEPEFRHWRDVGDYGEATVPEPLALGGRAVGKAVTAAIADRTVWLVDGQEIVPGLEAVAAPGHTRGQTALLLRDGDDALLLGGDFATHELIQLERPASHMVVDYDGAAAIDSRRRLLRRAADEGLLVHAFHFAWPGIGYVTGNEDRWRFVPAGGPQPS